MKIEKVENNQIWIKLPLTEQSGKTRIKIRNSFYEYGIPTATRQIPFSQKHYVEWQIGYDVDKKDRNKLALTTLQNTEFTGANDKIKALYELSEYLYYFKQFGLIKEREIHELINFLSNINHVDFLDSNFQILRTRPINRQILGIDFYCSEVKYPLLVHQFGNFDILVEIIIKEKQRAIGVQPMLYVCFPITELILQSNNLLLGRAAEIKEYAYLVLDSKHKQFILECFKIFGILSPNHNHDVIQI